MIDLILSEKSPAVERENKERKIVFTSYFNEKLNYDDFDAMIIQTKDLKDMQSKITKVIGKNKLIIVEGNSDLVNRASLENKKVFMLLSPEKIRKSDSINSRNSGLNQVLCELARKNDKIIGINIQDITNEKISETEKAKIIGRVMQNIKLCKKYKCKIILLSCNKPETKEKIKSIAASLGFSTQQIKEMENLKIK